MAAEDLNLENLEDVEDLEGLKGLFDGDMDLESDGLPSRKKLMEMLANSNMTEEMKENMKNLLGGGAPQLFGASSGGSYIGLVFILVIFSILLFFGYKLYKSIKEKELKREEKKKQKQLKKKK